MFNEKLRNYCLNSTYETLKKKLERNKEERNSKHVQFNLVTTPSVPNSINPVAPILVFLSISSLVYYFYNYKKYICFLIINI